MNPAQFNQTAYRIMLLLRWLAEKPMTLNEINERFKKEPSIGKAVSQDTLWLYINTLKALGCEISRPMPSNRFSYCLTHHPFTHFLTSQDLQILKETLVYIDDGLEFSDVVHFNRWLQKIFHHAANRNRNELSYQFFADTRILNCEAVEKLLDDLETYCQQQQLIDVYYHSPLNGLKQIAFLPEKLFHHQGVLYVLGQSAHRDRPSMLRLDRVEEIIPFEDEGMYQALLQKQMAEQFVLVRFLDCDVACYQPLGDEVCVTSDEFAPEHLLVQFRVTNDFLFQQKLLISGRPFQVMYPQALHHGLRESLAEMREMYAV